MDIKIPSNAKVKIHWKTSPYDFSEEKEKEIIALANKKYGIPKKQIVVDPIFLEISEDGQNTSITHEIIENIQDPLFQQQLFKTYISENKIVDYDFDKILEIDSKINSQIDYEVYDKYQNYSIKYVKFSNFLSYGADNYIDFRNFKDIVLLNSNPANQGGKTTIACDLMHFLLFGKTSKAAVNEKIFNKNLPDATEVIVEGCIEIKGEEYVIKRTLTRPPLSKRTAKSKTVGKVEYYKKVGDSLEELEEYVESQEGESVQKTNKIIKESIGNESDFDMIICATNSNLDDLIEKKDTERGRLLSKWIGLNPIEEKDVLARQEYNKNVKPYLLSNHYNIETLKQEKEALKIQKEEYIKKINDIANEIKDVENKIISENKNKEQWESMKLPIDKEIAKLDIQTITRKINDITIKGKNSATLIESLKKEIDEIGDVNFVPTDYDALNNKIANYTAELAAIRERCKSIKIQIEVLQKGEYCPTCGRKLDNIDNSQAILKLNNEYQEDIQKGIETKKILDSEVENLNKLKSSRDLFDKKNRLNLQMMTETTKKTQLGIEYRDEISKKNQYEGNQNALLNNNKCDNNINIIISNINNLNNQQKRASYEDGATRMELQKIESDIVKHDEMIQKIIEEQQLIKNWNIYLSMVGKDGISKMVLRKTIPVINAQLHTMLNEITDFEVILKINDKNEINFYISKDGIEADISSGSGFEKTAASLALRAVLGKISRLPKLDGLVLDEIFGRVAETNLDKMKTLLDRIVTDCYKYVINITHIEVAKDWSNQIITVYKNDNGVSYIS